MLSDACRPDRDDKPVNPAGGYFPSTHWSVVLAATGPERDGALRTICEIYHGPIYVFVRRMGYSEDAARDLTQGFLEELLEQGSIGNPDQAKGPFRNYLCGRLRFFLNNRFRHDTARKRGGGRIHVSIADDVEERLQQDLVDPGMTPEKELVRALAASVLQEALDDARKTCARTEYGEALFECLEAHLFDDEDAPAYRLLASRLDRSPEAVRKAAERMRDRIAKGISNRLEVLGEFGADGSCRFAVDELKDPTALASRLKSGMDALSAYIRRRLGATTQAALETWQPPTRPSRDMQEKLVDELNGMLEKESLWDDTRFEKVVLREETRNRKESRPSGTESYLLNRLLLEDAYPVELDRLDLPDRALRILAEMLAGG